MPFRKVASPFAALVTGIAVSPGTIDPWRGRRGRLGACRLVQGGQVAGGKGDPRIRHAQHPGEHTGQGSLLLVDLAPATCPPVPRLPAQQLRCSPLREGTEAVPVSHGLPQQLRHVRYYEPRRLHRVLGTEILESG